MLFIIINNEENWGQDLRWDQSLSESDTSDIVDELIERLENEALENESIDTLLDIEIQDEESTEVVDSDERGFFSRLFWRASISDPEINEVDNDSMTIDNEFWPQEWSEDTSIIDQAYAWESMESSISDSDSYIDIPYQQVNNVEIGQRFRVVTHSLRLNNKYFNETLGFLMYWDELISISESNSFGCFLAEVIDSNTAWGMQWFVCQRFISAIWEELYKDYTVQIEDEEVFPEVLLSSQIWDLITISQFQVDIDNNALFSWDQIEQLSEIDDTGCFIWRVHFIQDWWYISLIWYTKQFCAHEIVR